MVFFKAVILGCLATIAVQGVTLPVAEVSLLISDTFAGTVGESAARPLKSGPH